MKKQLWEKIASVRYLYFVTDKNGLTIIESPQEDKYASVRVFFKINEAEEYGKYLISSGALKQTSLNVSRISLENLFLMNEEFEALAEQEFDAPIRVMLNQKKKKDEGYTRDVIFDSLQTKN